MKKVDSTKFEVKRIGSGIRNLDESIPARLAKGSVKNFSGSHGAGKTIMITSVANEDNQAASQLRLLTNAMPHMVWTTNSLGVPEYFNLKWFEYVGVPIGTKSYPNWLRFVHPDDRKNVNSKRNYSLKTGQEFELEFRLKGVDNRYRWFLGRGVPFKDYQGHIIKWVVTCTDIHDRKRSGDFNKLLAKTSEVLSSTLEFHDALPKIIKLIVPHFADWCEIDLVEEELSLKYFAAMPTSQDAQMRFLKDLKLSKKLLEVVRTGKSKILSDISSEFKSGQDIDLNPAQTSKKAGLKTFMIVPLVARGKTLGAISFMASQSDRHFEVQDLRMAEELGRRAGLALENARLYQSARRAVELRDEFLSLAAHELKTPLTSLRLQLQLAERSVSKLENTRPSPLKVAQVVEKSLLQVDRLTALVEDLLDVSRIQVGKMKFNCENFDLAELTLELARRLEEKFILARCPMELNISEPVVGMWGRSQVEQIINNLLTNAIKYAPGKPVKISVFKNGNNAVLKVDDQGPGIANNNRCLIFERFERASSARNINGLGLGLFIVKQIVDAHGGTVQAEGEFGKGATFVVTLPISSGHSDSRLQEPV